MVLTDGFIMIQEKTSISFTIFWYDTYGNAGSIYPYGGNFSWYLDGVYRGSTEMLPGNSHSEPFTFSGLTPGTLYTMEVRAFSYDQYGEYGNDMGTLVTQIDTLSRPALFAWDTPKVAGAKYYIGAAEWDRLMYNIAEVHYHATGTYYSFSQSVPLVGEVVTAARYNDCRAAIRSVPGYGTYIPQVASGEIVTAYQLNVLVGELNAIP